MLVEVPCRRGKLSGRVSILTESIVILHTIEVKIKADWSYSNGLEQTSESFVLNVFVCGTKQEYHNRP